ncbi:MAG: response regulator, partial [Clostridia bacterium]|nr:response regulator [Clostridia bacterium]
MLNIAVCDDEAVEIEYLVSLVQQWAKVNEKSVNILRFGSAEEFLFKYEDDKSIDILLLDIQMKEMDGIRLAQ